MGVYNSVHLPCPKCGTPIEAQSKALDGHVSHDYDHVPAEIAEDIEGSSLWCDKCNDAYTVVKLAPEKTFRMRLLKI